MYLTLIDGLAGIIITQVNCFLVWSNQVYTSSNNQLARREMAATWKT